MSRRDDESLIQALLDGKLSEKSFAKLEDRLRVEPELRALYLSYSRMDGTLGEMYANSESKVVSFKRKSSQRRMVWGGIAAAAAALAITVPFLGETEEPVSQGPVVEFGPESHGQIMHENGRADAQDLKPGSSIELAHGSASITLPSGDQAYFEGPGKLEYTADQQFRLIGGRAWFEPRSTELICRTSNLRVGAKDAGFGLIVGHGGREELHVLEGTASLMENQGVARPVSAGTSALWSKDDITLVQTTHSFSTGFPTAVTTFEEDFSEPDLTPLSGKMPDHGAGPWKIEYGGPLIEAGVLDTSSNMRHIAFAGLTGPPLDELSHILILTLETDDPGTSSFHSAGWAGVSLYTGDQERIFVGDPNGPAEGWAIHPVGFNARHTCPLLEGKTTVTLRYDFRTGLAQLFEGTDTSGPALASEWIEPGLQFDRIRIANGSQADAAMDAGKPASAAGSAEDVEVRGDIAIRRIRVRVLSSDRVNSTGS